MRLIKTLTLLLVPLVLASCATPNTNACAGWRPVRASAETVDYMAQNDPEALKEMIGHAEFGQAQGCWK